MEKKVISFDAWGTLIKSNPEYHAKKISLISKATHVPKVEVERRLALAKKRADLLVESTGKQPDRIEMYKENFIGLNNSKLNLLIMVLNQVFEDIKPIKLLDSIPEGSLITSNTVMIHGDALGRVLNKMYGVPFENMRFSDQVGVSKPNSLMFNHSVKPDIHVGDNDITDGACEDVGIKFMHIDEYKEILSA